MEAIGKQALRPKQEALEDKQRFPCNVRIRDVNGNEIGALDPGEKRCGNQFTGISPFAE
jgi:hypothetical protein